MQGVDDPRRCCFVRESAEFSSWYLEDLSRGQIVISIYSTRMTPVDVKPFRTFRELFRPAAGRGVEHVPSFLSDGFPEVVEPAHLAQEGCIRVSVGWALKTQVGCAEASSLDPREVSQSHSVAVRFFVELQK